MARKSTTDLVAAMKKGAAPATPAAESGPRPGRANLFNVTGYFPAAVKKQIRMIGAEHDRTTQQLIAEALNLMFAKYKKPEIAEVAPPDPRSMSSN